MLRFCCPFCAVLTKPSAKRIDAACLALLATLGLTVSTAHGQQRIVPMRPGMAMQRSAFNPAMAGRMLPVFPSGLFGFNPHSGFGNLAFLYANPYSMAGMGGNPYGASSAAGQSASSYGNSSTSSSDPSAGYLSGGASMTNGQGRFEGSQQQAYLLQEQVRGEQAANRREIFDEHLYERDKTPTAEHERQTFQQEQLERSRNNPPRTEIWSGQALNTLLADLQKLPARGGWPVLGTAELPLDEDGLKHINITAGNGGNAGLLKAEDGLHWPLAFAGEDFKAERERLSALAQQAVRQATLGGPVDVGTTGQMTRDLDQLHKELRRKAGVLPSSLYIEAKTFLNNCESAVRALQQRDAARHFTGVYALKAKTVPELVTFMTERGLRFAPAIPGGESAYVALCQALAAYDLTARAQIGQR
ncbi:MAG TPA: hypothetical protein VKU02_20110 [Gemmataceae bacterium]|nr:hypothetical protein [Gemmataceae bacterium]